MEEWVTGVMISHDFAWETREIKRVGKGFFDGNIKKGEAMGNGIESFEEVDG